MSNRRYWLGYLALLAISHLCWWLRDTSPEPRTEGHTLSVAVVDHGVRLPRRIAMSYRDYPADHPDAPVLVLIHGSPGGLQDFGALADSLRGHCRVIVPDLPGFGASRVALPDYSFAAHADYLEQLLNGLGLERVHLVPFSMGGGVALHFAHRAPGRVASISMVATIGVQELELFGQYELNHAVHAFQLAAIHALQWLTPHFGALEGFALNIPYARNFFDSDQRPLRGFLEEWQGPMLIVHGTRDFLVPIEAAREHARLVPQSRLVEYDGSHFLIWTHPQWLGEQLRDFVTEVESGQAPLRTTAEMNRIVAAQQAWNPHDAPPMRGSGLIVAMLLLALATLVSEDLTCIATGLLIAQGRLPFWAGSLACLLGIFIGDLLLFLVGRGLGRRALRRAPLRWWIRPAAVERASAWFRQKGARVIFISRFLPGLRLATYLTAGVLHIRLRSFILWFLLAAGVWTPLLVGVSVLLGRQVLSSVEAFEDYALPAILLLVASLWLIQKGLLPLVSHRGRRLWVGAWKRRTRWEFWPSWLIYLPLIPAILWWALRHRGLRTCTLANPGIPFGGLAGESKAEILAAMGKDAPWLPAYLVLDTAWSADRRRTEARIWMESHQLDFPIVVKPDVGERGRGVQIVRSAADLEDRLGRDPDTLILQDFVPGLEVGAFYLRPPGSAHGRLVSLAEKTMPVLVGDGRRTLEELILDDPRAVCQARCHFERHAARLLTVPPAGERISLVEVGTHALGSQFLDRQSWITPELEQAVDQIASSLPGFHLGRLDLRAPDLAHLQRGEDLKVLEVNGLTSEPAHIYDPSHSIFLAWKCLAHQWHRAFRFGAVHRSEGQRPPSWRQLWQGWRRHRRSFHPAGAEPLPTGAVKLGNDA